jgi:hypothetical protein
MELSAEVPQIWLRDADFHFDLGENEAALRSAARVLRTVPDYDGVLFSYFDQAELPTPLVLDSLARHRRSARAYAQHLIASGRLVPASETWRRLSREGHLDDALASSFIDLLLRHQRYDQAARSWAAYLDTRRRDYPARNLLFNGGFEQEPSGCALDWRLSRSEFVKADFDPDTSHSGSRALRLRFPGTTNLDFQHIAQVIPVDSGRYHLTAWVKTDGITTNEGPRILIYDAENASRLSIQTDPFSGTQSWKLSHTEFVVSPSTRLLSVRLVRRPSAKFDNKIEGTVWFDDIALTKP